MSLGAADLKSALGKKRRDGKSAPLQPLTAIQRIHIGRLVEKYGDDYQVVRVSQFVKLINLFSLLLPLVTSLLFCRVCSWIQN